MIIKKDKFGNKMRIGESISETTISIKKRWWWKYKVIMNYIPSQADWSQSVAKKDLTNNKIPFNLIAIRYLKTHGFDVIISEVEGNIMVIPLPLLLRQEKDNGKGLFQNILFDNNNIK